MRAAEAITEFCERTGKPESHVKLVDRALREAGFRSKGRGVHAPHLTPEDWIRLLIGAYGAPVASQAQEFVQRMSDSYAHNVVNEGETPNSISDVENTLGISVDEMANDNLITSLVKICRHVALCSSANDNVQMVIEQGWGVEVVCGSWPKCQDLLTFTPPSPMRCVKEVSIVPQNILAWLGDVMPSDAMASRRTA